MQIHKAEAPGPSADKLVPRLANTAQLLYTVYLGLTVLAVLALVCAGVPLFDAVLLGFGALGTGGFHSLQHSHRQCRRKRSLGR